MDFNLILQNVLGGFSIDDGIVNTIKDMDLYEKLGKTIVDMYPNELEKYSKKLEMDIDDYGTIVKN